jgi:hypothetical protein
VRLSLQRSKPKSIRSRQAKNHSGSGLFCCKKTPKTARCDNELAHHQRAVKKNCLLSMGAVENEANYKYNFYRAADDKSYLRPGTSVGATGAKSQAVFQSVQNERTLPQHDFSDPRLHVTPSSHRFMEKVEVRTGDGSSRLVTVIDQSVVFARPKAEISSTGTSWVNEEMFIRHNEPNIYEIPQAEHEYSQAYRGFCSAVKDKVTHFLDSTTESDLKDVSNAKNCPYRAYEEKRLKNLTDYFSLALDMRLYETFMRATEQETANSVAKDIRSIIARPRPTT